MTILWREKRGIHVAPAEGSFINEQGTAMKPLILADFNCHRGYVQKEDRMANSYFISHCTCKCTNILFFLLLDLATVKQWSASFFMWQEENFTIHVNILVPSFKVKYAVDTGQPWHTLQMVVLLISTLSNTEVIPYFRSLISETPTPTMLRITYRKMCMVWSWPVLLCINRGVKVWLGAAAM